MKEAFIRTSALIGKDNIEKLAKKKVAIFGLGGVGGYVLEGLVRSNITDFTLIDNDVFSESNLNRQLLATLNTIGRRKTEVAKERVLSINADANVKIYDIFYGPETEDQIDLSEFDYVIDAIDTVSAKLLLIKKCVSLGVKIISCMGTGNKLHPEMFTVSDIKNTSYCPLAKTVRRELKKLNIESGVNVLYSKEEPISPDYGDTVALKGNHIAPASISFVPSIAGLTIAGFVVKELIK